jgi:hypothetical protein
MDLVTFSDLMVLQLSDHDDRYSKRLFIWNIMIVAADTHLRSESAPAVAKPVGTEHLINEVRYLFVRKQHNQRTWVSLEWPFLSDGHSRSAMRPGRVRNSRRQTLRVDEASAKCRPLSGGREGRPRRTPSPLDYRA